MTAENYTCRHCKQVLSIDLDKDDAFKVGFDHAWNNHAHTIAAAIERPQGIKGKPCCTELKDTGVHGLLCPTRAIKGNEVASGRSSNGLGETENGSRSEAGK